ncbi:MAG: 2,4-diaminopentanoate dehydrogenase [Treponema sp.]|nr:2,4-diaminopentanoate dehydrogenase [Treponema sp.]
MENVKVALWGFGAMGSGMARMLLEKRGVDIVGVCDAHPERVGKSLYAALGVERAGRAEVIITDKIAEALVKGRCDVCMIATDSFVKKVFDKIKFALEQGANVITIAEEMSYPKAQSPELALEMDKIAKANGVSVLGTGINPGLAMDLLAVCLSGAMTRVDGVLCRRVNSLSPFGETVMEEQGVGISVEAFEKGAKSGALAGHVGFAESIGMISDALGLGVERFEQQMEPIVTKVDRVAPHGSAKAGNVAGINMSGQGYKGAKKIITMEHPQQIEPETEGVFTGDYIELSGEPAISMQIKPEISGGLGTIAMAVNCIPHVINARAGLRTMIDIPVPRAIMGDFRDCVDPDKKIVR